MKKILIVMIALAFANCTKDNYECYCQINGEKFNEVTRVFENAQVISRSSEPCTSAYINKKRAWRNARVQEICE